MLQKDDVLDKSSLATIWDRISALFLRRTEATEFVTSTPAEDALAAEAPSFPMTMSVSGTKLYITTADKVSS